MRERKRVKIGITVTVFLLAVLSMFALLFTMQVETQTATAWGPTGPDWNPHNGIGQYCPDHGGNGGTHQVLAGRAFDYAARRFPTLYGARGIELTADEIVKLDVMRLGNEVRPVGIPEHVVSYDDLGMPLSAANMPQPCEDGRHNGTTQQRWNFVSVMRIGQTQLTAVNVARG